MLSARHRSGGVCAAGTSNPDDTSDYLEIVKAVQLHPSADILAVRLLMT